MWQKGQATAASVGKRRAVAYMDRQGRSGKLQHKLITGQKGALFLKI
jgi:hypothetical protein